MKFLQNFISLVVINKQIKTQHTVVVVVHLTMKEILFKSGIILLVAFSIVGCEVPMTNNSVIGKYANTNYGNQLCCMNSPHKPDTLVLKSDNTFTSAFYGTGTYKIVYGTFKTQIEWTYDYKIDSIIIDTYFENNAFGNTKIILNADMNHYYEKIK